MLVLQPWVSTTKLYYDLQIIDSLVLLTMLDIGKKQILVDSTSIVTYYNYSQPRFYNTFYFFSSYSNTVTKSSSLSLLLMPLLHIHRMFYKCLTKFFHPVFQLLLIKPHVVGKANVILMLYLLELKYRGIKCST